MMMMMTNNKKMTITIVAFVAIVTATSTYAITSVVKGQASVFQNGQGVTAGDDGATSGLGESISRFTEDIISGANQQVQDTLESAGQQALPQLQANASQYDCLIIVMNFGKAHGAMTCSPGEQFTQAVGVNSANAPGSSSNVFQSQSQSQDGSARSSIQRDGNSALMQNQITGSGSSSNVIPGDVP